MAESNIFPALINGSATSDPINVGPGFTPVKIFFPTGFAGATATFTVSDSASGTYSPLMTAANAAVSYTVTANSWYQMDPALWYGVQWFKVVSANTETSKTVKILAARIGL